MMREHRRKHMLYWLVLTPIILGVLILAVATRANTQSQLNSQPSQQTSSKVNP